MKPTEQQRWRRPQDWMPDQPQPRMLLPDGATRREWLRNVGLLGLSGLVAGCTDPAASDASRGALPAPPFDQPVGRFPEKVAMRMINDRAPQLETPWRYFAEDITPNEAFFVRWHYQPIPTAVDLRTWRLTLDGQVNSPLKLSMMELRSMPVTEVVAVCQCSGNSRQYFEPRITGGQWGNGAMSNARWKGVRVKTLLERAGIKAKATEVAFNGMDVGPMPASPDFIKTLGVEQASEPDVIVAYEMNGRPLPMLNGFPLRLVVPGWYATYWVKALDHVQVLSEPFDGFWMAKAYKIPANADASELPDKPAKEKVPIHRMNVRSFWVNPSPETNTTRVRVNGVVPLEGIAMDGGAGIKSVEVSSDDGKSWMATELGNDLGNYSFRRWRGNWKPTRTGHFVLKVRATNHRGETQPMTAKWNGGGYMRNVVEQVEVDVV